MSESIDKHVIELLPAYALGSVEDEEAKLVSSHLAVCQQCQIELADYQKVTDLLSLAAPAADPSAQLKSQLMQRIGASEVIVADAKADQMVEGPSLSVPPTAAKQQDRPIGEAIRSWLAGPIWRPVAFLLIVILLASNGLLLLNTTSEPDSPTIQPTFPWRRPVILAGTEAAPEAVGILYISVDGLQGTLVVDGLPSLTADQQYQLWMNTEDVKDSGAVFSVSETGYRGIEIESPLPLEIYETFGITVEPEGGSSAPTGERVLFFEGDALEPAGD
jgi:anti-sigma-K factor RskA